MSEVRKQFVDAARSYCAWCVAEHSDAAEQARVALAHLSTLYRLGMGLRELDAPDVEEREVTHAEWQATYDRLGPLPFGYYRSVFDPQLRDDQLSEGLDSACELGDLADDLADIWRDLTDGLTLFDCGHGDAAEYQWAWSFRSHWGRHAASALHVLHCWIADEGEW